MNSPKKSPPLERLNEGQRGPGPAETELPARLARSAADAAQSAAERDRLAAQVREHRAAIDALEARAFAAEARATSLARSVGALGNELSALTRSWSWRITRPLRLAATAVRVVLNRLGLRSPRLALDVGKSIDTLADGRHASHDADHWFDIHMPSHELPRGFGPGWHAVRLLGVDRADRLSPVIYPDYGTGSSETSAIGLPAKAADGGWTYVRFNRRVRALRLDPSDRSLEFKLAGIEIRRVPAWLAIGAMGMPLARQALSNREILTAKIRGLLRIWRKGGTESIVARIQTVSAERSDYGFWVRSHDDPAPSAIAAFVAANDRLAAKPTVSLIVPVYNTPERWLRAAIESVIAQTYPHWELCIADDASTSAATVAVLAEYSVRDKRIRVTRRKVNGHISAASNSALALATGKYVALLDHDDEIAPTALYWMVEAIERNPDAVLVYSDEDKIDEDGNRFDPYFKPDWNPELALCQNFVNHLTVYRRDAVIAAGGFREGFEGSQDWDLMLRLVGGASPSTSSVVHVPRVLYHWRSTAGSTALSSDAKGYASDAGVRAVTESIMRRTIDARVEKTTEGYHRIRYALPPAPPMVSIIIPTRNAKALVETCMESLIRLTAYPAYEIILVDNQSDDAESLRYFNALEARGVRVLRYDAPFNFSAINNFAVDRANGDIVLLLNNDIEVIDDGWLTELVSHAVKPENGVVGGKLLYPDRTIQHAGVVVGFGGVAGHIGLHQPRDFPGQMSRCRVAQNMTAVTGACLALRKSVYLEAGGLDAQNLKVAFNDIDLCLKVAALGYRNVWTPHAELIHHESASRGYEDTPEKQARFAGEARFMMNKWGDALLSDPAYNPNLDLERQVFALAFPPRVNRMPKDSAAEAMLLSAKI